MLVFDRSCLLLPTEIAACQVHVEIFLKKYAIAYAGPWPVRIRNGDIKVSENLQRPY